MFPSSTWRRLEGGPSDQTGTEIPVQQVTRHPESIVVGDRSNTGLHFRKALIVPIVGLLGKPS